MADQFENTFLNDIASYDNPNVVGYATYWVSTLTAQGDFRTTYLDDMANYDGPNLGYATNWVKTI
jgi:hypothetical protein